MNIFICLLTQADAQCHLAKAVCQCNGLKSIVTKSVVPTEPAFCRTVGSVSFCKDGL